MPATLSILIACSPSWRARKAIGIWSASAGSAWRSARSSAAVLLAHFGWDSIFLVNLPLSSVALAAGHWLVPASRAPVARRLDIAGAIASVAAFTMLTWALIAAPGSGWLSAATLGRLAGAGVLLTAFAVIEARGDHPMLPLSLFRNRRLAGAAIALLALFFALSGAVFLTTQIYQVVLGCRPLAAGLRALPSAMTLAIAAAAARNWPSGPAPRPYRRAASRWSRPAWASSPRRRRPRPTRTTSSRWFWCRAASDWPCRRRPRSPWSNFPPRSPE